MTIKERIDLLDEYYPKERIELSKKRYEKIWNGEIPEDRYPFVFAQYLFNGYNDIHTAEERIDITLKDLMSRRTLIDDTIPSLFPGCLQTTLPNMVGAPEIIIGEEHISEKIIKCADDISFLKISMDKGTVAYNWLEMIREMLDLTDGRIPIHVCDFQGPFDAAAQLCGYDNLIYLAYDNENAYDKLMRTMCDAFCMLWNEQKEIIPKELFVGTHLFGWNYIPNDIDCVTASIDSLAVVSSGFFEEYVLPYMEYMSEKMGKLVVHSCGDFGHNIKSLMKSDIVKGINASQMTVKQMMDKGLTNDKIVIVLGDTDSILKDMKECKEKDIKALLSVYGPYPQNEDKTEYLEFEKWSDKDIEMMKEYNQKLLNQAEIKEKK